MKDKACGGNDEHSICFEPKNGRLTIDEESYKIKMKKERKETEIHMDCTDTCRQFHGVLSKDPWDDVRSACNQSISKAAVERAFHCETHHYPDLREFKWPVGRFD